MASRDSVEATKRRQLLDRLTKVLDAPSDRVRDLLSIDRVSSLRLNPLRRPDVDVLRAEVEADGFGLEPLAWCANAYVLRGDKRALAASHWFQDGDVFLQNSSSFVPVVALDPQRGDAILDVAAAPGGKASHIAAIVSNDAELWLNDPLTARGRKLDEVLETLGVQAAQRTAIPGQYVDKEIDRRFDRILLDAQCSGEGLIDLRRRDTLRFWSMGRVLKYSRLQQRMLMAAFKLLAPGGTLVYSTCTFGPEENEHPIDHLVHHVPEAEVVPIELDLPNVRPALASWDGRRFDPQVREARRIVPTETMEGFFVAKIRRRA